MIRHERKHVHRHTISRSCHVKACQEHAAIAIVAKNRLAIDPAMHHVNAATWGNASARVEPYRHEPVQISIS